MHLTIRTLLLLSVVVAAVAAQSNLGCQQVWAGPSADNSIVDCLRGRVAHIVGLFAVSIVFLAFAAIATVIYLPFFCIRQCCNGCGGRVLRPGTCCYGGSEWDDRQEEAARQYTDCAVYSFRLFVVLICVLAIISVGMVSFGANRTFSAFRTTTLSITAGGVDALASIISAVNASLVVDGSFVPGYDPNSLSSVTSLLTRAREVGETVVTRGDDFDSIVLGVTAGVAAILWLTALVLVLLVCCSLRSCIPAMCTCWSWIWVVLFSLLTAVVLAANASVRVLEGEVAIGRDGLPGIVEWYLIPLCDSLNPSTGLATQIATTRVTQARSACADMLDLCDNSTTLAAMSSVQFTCNLTLASINASCTGARAVQAIVAGSSLKSGSTACTNSNCTLLTCATDCTTDLLRNTSAVLGLTLRQAVAAETALFLGQNIATCRGIVRTVLGPINVGDVAHVAIIFGVGFALCELTCIFFIIAFFKGQKLFLSSAERERSTKGSTYANDAA